MVDAEDIMCDQCIISSELNVHFDRTSYVVVPARLSHHIFRSDCRTIISKGALPVLAFHDESSSDAISRIWIAIDLLTKTVLPPFSTIFCAFLRNPPQTILHNVRHEILPALIAFLANKVSQSLASVQRISLPLTLRIMKDQNGRNQAVITDGEDRPEVPEKSVECVVLSAPEDIFVDVIFVHGLHGGLDRTWKQGTWRRNGHKLTNQSPVRRQSSGDLYVPPTEQSLKRTLSGIYSRIPRKMARREHHDYTMERKTVWEADSQEENLDYSQCWPKDWIPKDCPNARVIALNYSTDVLWCPAWTKKRKRTDMVTRSQEMIEELIRLGVGRKPIVWVGHSKGGLFIKQIIVNAWENSQERIEVRDIFRQSKSIMWYSVPHKGSLLADFKLPLLRRSVELLEIQRNCNSLSDLHQRFLSIVENESVDLEVFSFIETAFTLMFLVYMKIVAYDSAEFAFHRQGSLKIKQLNITLSTWETPRIICHAQQTVSLPDPSIGVKCDVPLDHREICKPAGRDCFLYLELLKLINKCLERHS